jgi:hypothetical protein
MQVKPCIRLESLRLKARREGYDGEGYTSCSRSEHVRQLFGLRSTSADACSEIAGRAFSPVRLKWQCLLASKHVCAAGRGNPLPYLLTPP